MMYMNDRIVIYCEELMYHLNIKMANVTYFSQFAIKHLFVCINHYVRCYYSELVFHINSGQFVSCFNLINY